MAVPEAGRFPSTPRPVRSENSAISSAGNPWGNVGNGRSRTRPRELPVPGRAVLTRTRRLGGPVGGPGIGDGRHPREGRTAAETERRQMGEPERTVVGRPGEHVAQGVATVVAVPSLIGRPADPQAVEHDQGRPPAHAAPAPPVCTNRNRSPVRTSPRSCASSGSRWPAVLLSQHRQGVDQRLGELSGRRCPPTPPHPAEAVPRSRPAPGERARVPGSRKADS